MPDLPQLIDQLAVFDRATGQNHSYNALIEMGEAAVEPLIAAIHHPNPEVRQRLARVLAKIGDPRAIPALMTMTQDAAQPVRTAAVTELGSFQAHPQVAEFLRQFALSTHPPETRVHAIHAYKRIAGQAAFMALCLQLLNDPTDHMVINAAHNIGQTKDPAALEPLLNVLHRYAATPTKTVMILQALGNLGDPRALPPIAAYLQVPDAHVRGVAVGALQALGDPRAIEYLEPLTGDRGVAYQDELPNGVLGPTYSVGQLARDAIQQLRAKHGLSNPKPRWKLW